MVVDGSRIPAPGISKSRLARPASLRPAPTTRPAPSPLRPSHRQQQNPQTSTSSLPAPASPSIAAAPSTSSSSLPATTIPTPRRHYNHHHNHNHNHNQQQQQQQPTTASARRAAARAAPTNADRADPPSAARRRAAAAPVSASSSAAASTSGPAPAEPTTTPRRLAHRSLRPTASRLHPPSSPRHSTANSNNNTTGSNLAKPNVPAALSSSASSGPSTALSSTPASVHPVTRFAERHTPRLSDTFLQHAQHNHYQRPAPQGASARPSLPDRGHAAARAPSPRRRLLQESPYSRRSSTGGAPISSPSAAAAVNNTAAGPPTSSASAAARQHRASSRLSQPGSRLSQPGSRLSQPGTRTRSAAGSRLSHPTQPQPVVRRLNMHPAAEDDDPSANTATNKARGGLAAATAKPSVAGLVAAKARRSSLPRNPDRPTAARRASGPAPAGVGSAATNGSSTPGVATRPRRSSGSGASTARLSRGGGVSALESFRAARRASLEGAGGGGDGGGCAPACEPVAPVPSHTTTDVTSATSAASVPGFPPSFHALGGPTIIPVDPPSDHDHYPYQQAMQQNLAALAPDVTRRRTLDPTSGGTSSPTAGLETNTVAQSAAANATPAATTAASTISAAAAPASLPDRPDGSALRRQGTRFSEANVCTKDVDLLRTSLGRRRSIDLKDPIMPQTPTLRRSSLGVMGGDDGMALTTIPGSGLSSDATVPGISSSTSAAQTRQRSPLRSIFSNGNGENVAPADALAKKDSFGSADGTGSVTAGMIASDAGTTKSVATVARQSKGGKNVPKWDEYDLDVDMEDVEDLGAGW